MTYANKSRVNGPYGVHPILVGLNGWHRWGGWAAHFYKDGAHLCDTAHGNFMGGDFEPKKPSPADVAPNGVPYGKVCQRCLRLAAPQAGKDGSNG